MEDSIQNEQREFGWTAKREQAALLTAADELTRQEICAQIGIGLTTLDRWRLNSEFRVRVEHHVYGIRARIRCSGIAIIENRIKALQRRWEKLHEIIAERSIDPKMADVPGGKTGLVVQTVKSIGSGDSYERILLYEVDTALLSELRQHEKQAAQELGQWAEKHEFAGPHGGPIKAEVNVTFDHDLYARLFEQREGAIAAGNGDAPPAGDGVEQPVHPEDN